MDVESGQEVETKSKQVSRTQIERAQLHLSRLDQFADSRRVEEAQGALRSLYERGAAPTHIHIRRAFIRCPNVPPPLEQHRSLKRPPVAALLTPNGVALQLELLALFVAQVSKDDRRRGAGHLPLPLEATEGTGVGWADLVVAETRTHKGIRVKSGPKSARMRQTKRALDSLSNLALMDLPNAGSAKGKYEGFRLLHEGGRRNFGDPVLYEPPHPKHRFSVPVEFFLNGWIYALSKSQIALWLTLRDLAVTVRRTTDLDLPGELRSEMYGLSHDAYKTWKVLEHVGLLSATVDERRREDGRAQGFQELEEPLHAHRFTLVDEGLQKGGVESMRQALRDQVSGLPMGVAKLAEAKEVAMFAQMKATRHGTTIS